MENREISKAVIARLAVLPLSGELLNQGGVERISSK